MIAGCPKCSAKYRVDVERIGPDGAKLRCTKCSAVFLVRAPEAKPVAAAPAPPPPAPVAAAPQSEPQVTAAAANDAVAPQTTAGSPESGDSDGIPSISENDRPRLVIVADPDEDRAKTSAEAVTRWGLIPHVVHDGVEAMLSIQRLLPAAVVLDAALPKMFGFQVCEVIKRNESLRETVTVLVGAIHHQDRYRRSPTDLYGADVYVEQPDLPEGLLPILREAGLPVQGGEAGAEAVNAPAPEMNAPAGEVGQAERTLDLPVTDPTPEPEPEPELALEPPPAPVEVAAPPAPAEAPAAPPAPVADEDPERKEERERAERLARIAVSEMLLYQPEKFDQASRDGNLETVLDMEISEARALLRQRISEEVRAETDFVMDELLRVAAERSAQS